MHEQRPARAAVFAMTLFVSCGATAVAQTKQGTTPRWEVEGYGGVSRAQRPGAGTVVLPEAGAPLTSTSPIFPVRRTPSWFFGDGALMLNQALEALELGERIAPLDEALGSLGAASATGAAFGVRLRRGISPRVDAEVGFDVMTGSAGLPDELVAAASAGGSSFETAMTSLFASGPFTGTEVSARTIAGGGSTRELAITGALSIRLREAAALVPYVTVGGGLIAGVSEGDALTLEGRYRTTVDVPDASGVPIDETDRVTLRYGHGRTFVGLAGAGVRRDLSAGWAVRVEGRVLIGRDTTRLLIDADPTVARGTPAGVIETFTHPSLQFSNDPSTGRESSLGGGLDGFEAFRGDGLSTRVLITVGLVRRF
jgi:hypothetical protein